MEATESPAEDHAKAEAKTVFNVLSKLKESDSTDIEHVQVHKEVDEDIVILKRDPETKLSTINRPAYLKLHRSLSPNRANSIDKIRGNFEKSENEPAETNATIESIKSRYSPAGLGYTKKPPTAKPRKSLTKSQIITPSKRDQTRSARLSLNIEKNKHKDVNANDLNKTDVSSEEEEYVTIVTRSDSEESIYRIQEELSAFTMDKKKRTSSFRKIFSVFSNKDKNKRKTEKTQNSENLQNESNTFSRQSPYRHTTGAMPQKQNQETNERNLSQQQEQLIKEYEALNINQLAGYTRLDKPIYNRNQEPSNPYMNMPKVRKYIDTSSSASTLESSGDRSNVPYKPNNQKNTDDDEVEVRSYPINSFRPSRVTDGRRDTPPRLLETNQDFRLVNPKVPKKNPINSERPLPNPYQNGVSPTSTTPRGKPLSQSTPTKPYVEENYGTVFDSVDSPKSPKVASVEATKLKLPPNREIVPLSPRVKSPIPSDNVSTDKIIATELLKPKSPNKRDASSNSHQRFDVEIDYPENINYNLHREKVVTKPPLSGKQVLQRPAENFIDPPQLSPSSNESVVLRHKPEKLKKVVTDAQVHTATRTPTPNSNKFFSTQNLSLSPARPNNLNFRPSTPLGSQIIESPKTTPQKEDIRKSVEAYYWKEIKKLKDQENYELYMLQMQYGNTPQYGYQEDPINVRRSRSMSPMSSRNGRRSLSLPRENRPPPNIIPESYYPPNVIPENRAVINNNQPRSMQQLQFQQQLQQHFQRNAPERSTIDGSSRKFDGNNSLYRPIFKRGSLSTPPQTADDTLKRKVSFSGGQNQHLKSWPTRNGYTQSPPQRRIDKVQSQGDDEVFLPNPYSNTRVDPSQEEMYYNTRTGVLNNSANKPVYVLRANQNSLYLHQRRPIENPYGQKVIQPEELVYGQPIDSVTRSPSVLSRHGSIQLQEELYGRSRMSYQNVAPRPPVMRREIIVNDEIFGQFGGYSGMPNNVRVISGVPQNIYASRQSVDQMSNYSRPPLKQVSVNNKVCDIYGQIHDSEMQKSGVLMGRLHQNPGSPMSSRNSYGGDNFVRNNRLTASANDMHRRTSSQRLNESLYGRIEQQQQQEIGAPSRPLPPVPHKKGKNVIVSDTESGSDASEIQRILNSKNEMKGKTKKRGIFGK